VVDSEDAAGAAKRRLGTTIRGTSLSGEYRLDTLIGIGGMAAVYGASPRNDEQRRVAIKILHASVAADTRRRFQREPFIANSVGHRGAVRVLEADTAEDGAGFLVMEMLEGETVEAVCERAGGRLPLRRVAEIAHELLEVLAAAHDHGIIHRDIKPANLFLTRAGDLKVLDFGIARGGAVGGGTTEGMIMGTPCFMAPEQAWGQQDLIDVRSDVWAVGATMFRLVSGRCVHEGRCDPYEVIVAVRSRPAQSIRAAAPETPQGFVAAIDRALALGREARWPSAREMAGALREAYSGAFGSPMPGAGPQRGQTWDVSSRPPPVSEPIPLPRHPRPWRATWAGVAIAGGIVGAAVLVGRHRAASPSLPAAVTPVPIAEVPLPTPTPSPSAPDPPVTVLERSPVRSATPPPARATVPSSGGGRRNCQPYVDDAGIKIHPCGQ
jgi:serine/threonine-protein kinase